MNEMSRNERESSEERKLELRLGPPGVEDWLHTNNKQRLSFGNYFSSSNNGFQHVRGNKESSSSQTCCPKRVELQNGDNNKVTAVSNTSQKRYYTFSISKVFYFYLFLRQRIFIHSVTLFFSPTIVVHASSVLFLSTSF